MTQQLRFPFHMAVAAHVHGRFRTEDDLRNRLVLGDDFLHTPLDRFDVPIGHGMADIQLAVQRLAQGVLYKHLSLRV